MALPKYLQSVLLVAGGLVAGVVVMWMLGPKEAGVENGPPVTSPAGAGASKAEQPISGGTADVMSRLSGSISIADRDRRGESLRSLATELAGGEAAKAVELAERIPDVDDRLEFIRALFGAWGARAPRSAMEFALGHFPAGLAQGEALVAVAERWGAANAREAWLWVDGKLSGPVKEQATSALVMGWTRVEPENAAAWFLSTGSTSQGVLDALVTTWAGLDARAAAVWVEGLAQGENRTVGRVLVAGEWARQDARAAAEFFSPLMVGEAAIDLGSALVNSWAALAPADAAAWVAKLPPGPGRANAAGTLATIWAGSDIDAAVRWSATIEDVETRDAIVDQLGTTWGAIEPLKALAWVDSLPEGAAKEEARRGALGSWAATNAKTMESWLAEQPPGPVADSGREFLAAVYADSRLADAMRQSVAISDETRRGDAVAKFFREWRKVDDAGAQNWVKSAWPSLGADVRARLEREQKRK